MFRQRYEVFLQSKYVNWCFAISFFRICTSFEKVELQRQVSISIKTIYQVNCHLPIIMFRSDLLVRFCWSCIFILVFDSKIHRRMQLFPVGGQQLLVPLLQINYMKYCHKSYRGTMIPQLAKRRSHQGIKIVTTTYS